MLLDFIHKINPLNKGWLSYKERQADAALAAKEELVTELDASITARKTRITETATRLERLAETAIEDFHRFEGQA